MQIRYLNHLQAKLQAPTYEYLRTLVRRHLQRIPFENISKIHYYLHQAEKGLQWLPSMETYLDNAIGKGTGGNCYILNEHFGLLLTSIGYEVDIVRATGGNTHLALRVTVEGQPYYVDVGYGAPLFEPLILEEQPHFTRYGEEVRVTKLSESLFVIDRRANGQSFVSKTIEWRPVTLDSFGDAITHSLRDEDENPFMRRIVATLFKGDAAYSVVNHKLFIKSDQGTEVHEYTRQKDWLAMMRATFGFDPAMAEEAAQFLHERGVVLFSA